MEGRTVLEYQLTGLKAYSKPGSKVGNKHWVNIPPGTSEHIIKKTLEKEIEVGKDERVPLDS
ncbi:MAG: hypothetical protein H0Z30_01405 [Candidatus Marinimicrobia bacterium]|nr:hypothetical protein [Candidatus Neomarinimicrobiota bacterium]HDN60100.1 hypothetical protein [Candidatus Neomarinimicrobiota bacterium]